MDLRIYVAGHCPVSRYSIELAREIRHAFPHLDVQVVDVEQFGEAASDMPHDVLFTPGYFLAGRPIYWGNPTREELFNLLTRLGAGYRQGDVQ